MKGIITPLLVSFLLLSSSVINECGKNSVDKNKSLTNDSSAIDSSMFVIKDTLINIKLSLPKNIYRVNEPIEVTMNITNNSNDNFDIEPFFQPGDVELMFYFLDEKNELLKYKKEGLIIDYIVPTHIVKPNNSVEKQFTVNQYAPLSSLFPGKYRIFSHYRKHSSDTVGFEVVE